MKRFWLVLALVLAGAQTMFGFAMIGPYEFYQVPTIGYHLVPPSSSFANEGNGVDAGAPKNFGQGYRINTPTNYYSFDDAFIRYFGATGQSNIDAAFAMYNNLTNVSNLNLDDWPNYNATRVNYRAQALQLLDLKSFTMSLIIEQLGLAQPDRWVWCLHSRDHYGPACTDYDYSIIQRNFDPYTHLYSPYVNDVFYDYQIEDLACINPNVFAPLEADAVEIVVDPTFLADSQSAVAADGSVFNYGSFFLSFTRDDIGGLKALYSATNAYAELAETNSQQILTNTATPVLIVTSNLALFEAQALTNNDAALQALYPDLVILTNLTTNFWSNVVTTNITGFLTNPPFAPAGTIELLLVTNKTTNVETLFFHTYANLEVVSSYSQGFVSEQTVELQPVPFAPAGEFRLVTNTVRRFQNFTNGAFYILPTNLCGPYQIVSTQFVQVVATTNFVPIATNIPTLFTNVQVTNVATAFINYFTNLFLIGYPVDCITNNEAVREGMEKFSFVRRDDYDSVAGRFIRPFTNTYHLTAISNGVAVVQTFQRLMIRPDILIDSADIAAGPAAPPGASVAGRTFPTYVTNLVPVGNGGPGTIEPTGIVFTYDSVGPIYFNTGPFFIFPDGVLDFPQTNSIFIFQWGSFDATTNTPVVYPDTNSIAQMEANLFYQITTSLLPDASVSANGPGNPYSYTLQTSGNLVPPLTWSLTPTSGGLPPGMTLSSDGTISGSPTSVGTYDFTVQVTDAYAKVTQKNLYITVDP